MVNLRDVLDDELGFESYELISDKAMHRMYLKAVNWYRKYRLFPRTDTYNFSIETGDYVPDILMDTLVEVDGAKKKLSDIVDTETLKYNGTGTITVTIALTSNNAYLTGLPRELEGLFVAYCKLAIGQRLTFATYPSQPFTLDGQSLKSAGETERAEWEKFIMINRDEDPRNITDLRKEAYTGIKSIYVSRGTFLW